MRSIKMEYTHRPNWFDIGSHGKPYIIGYEQVHFNISHSDNICICVVDDMPIGIDIQKMKP